MLSDPTSPGPTNCSGTGTQLGFSLVEVLLALGLLSFLAIALSTALTGKASSRKSLAQKEAHQQIDQLIRKTLVDLILDKNCPTMQDFAASIPLFQGTSLELLSSIESRKMQSDSHHEIALRRCENPTFQNSSYHFCMKVEVDGDESLKAAGMESLVGAKNVFVEVLAEPFDFHRSAPARCQDLAAANSYFGLRILYSLYWETQQTAGIQSNRKTGLYMSLPNS